MMYPLALFFTIIGYLFLFIVNPTHVIYYIVFLIIGGFLAMLYITIGDVICEMLINEVDLSISLKGVKKCALAIDILSNAFAGVVIFLMSYFLDWLMIGFCVLSACLLLYWLVLSYNEYDGKERNSDNSSTNGLIN